jgi:hypothetical protein
MATSLPPLFPLQCGIMLGREENVIRIICDLCDCRDRHSLFGIQNWYFKKHYRCHFPSSVYRRIRIIIIFAGSGFNQKLPFQGVSTKTTLEYFTLGTGVNDLEALFLL